MALRVLDLGGFPGLKSVYIFGYNIGIRHEILPAGDTTLVTMLVNADTPMHHDRVGDLLAISRMCDIDYQLALKQRAHGAVNISGNGAVHGIVMAVNTGRIEDGNVTYDGPVDAEGRPLIIRPENYVSDPIVITIFHPEGLEVSRGPRDAE